MTIFNSDTVRLGKAPANIPQNLGLMSSHFKETLPEPPAEVTWSRGKANWGEMLNDKLGLCTCFPAGTRIRMADGTSEKIESLRVNDRVVTAEGNESIITNVMVRHENDYLVRIQTFGHSHLKLTAEHPIMTKRGYIPAKYLTSEDWIALPNWRPIIKDSINPKKYFNKNEMNHVKETWPEEIELSATFGRIIGLFMAEGSINQNTVRWTFGGHEIDTFAKELCELLEIELGIKAVLRQRPNKVVDVVVCGKHWRMLFEKLCSKGCAEKFMHPDLWGGDNDFLMAVLIGWLDGDGHTKNGTRTGTTVSRKLAQDMFAIAQTLELKPCINGRNSIQDHLFRWDVAIRFNRPKREERGAFQEKRDGRWVSQGKENGKSIHLGQFETKTEALTSSKEWRDEHNVIGDGKSFIDSEITWRRIRNIHQEEFCGDVFNISVKGNESYIAEGVGVHNCAAIGHAFQVFTLNETSLWTPSDEDVLHLYEKTCGYNPNDPNSDNGGECSAVLAYIKKNPFMGWTIDGYGLVDHKDIKSVKQAIWMFGGLYIGVQLPLSAQNQDVWEVGDPSLGGNSAPNSWGGHAIFACDFSETDVTVITWGALQKMSWKFWEAYCDESYAILANAWTRGSKNFESPLGFSKASLEKNMKEVMNVTPEKVETPVEEDISESIKSSLEKNEEHAG